MKYSKFAFIFLLIVHKMLGLISSTEECCFFIYMRSWTLDDTYVCPGQVSFSLGLLAWYRVRRHQVNV